MSSSKSSTTTKEHQFNEAAAEGERLRYVAQQVADAFLHTTRQ